MKSLIKVWIKEWFKEKSPDIDLNLDENFFEIGAIDSFGIMELITDIEAHYNINFTQEEFQDPRFPNISGLSAILNEKIGNGS